ncbi:MAG: glycosyltransferase [Planctomycetota bacterium]
MTKLRVLFLLSSLEMGGAERVICHLLTALPRSRFEIHLAVLNGAGPLRQSIPSDVCIHDLKTPRVSRSAFALLRLVWKLRPGRVVSTGSHLNILTSVLRPLFPPKCRLLIRESAPVTFLGQSRGGVMKHLAMVSYRLADTVIAQSVTGTKELRGPLRLPDSRVTHIYNPVPFEHIDTAARAADCPFPGGTAGPHILSAARLDPVKGLDRLIKAFRSLLSHRPSAQLWIVGEGTERPKLEQLIQSLELQDHVHLAGFDANPWRWMRHADLFVLCSHVESLPNSLLEAIACRCPVVTLDIPGGTREIMEQLGLSSRIASRLEEWKDEWFERPDATVRQSAEALLGVETIAGQYARLLLANGIQDLNETLQPSSRIAERRAA